SVERSRSLRSRLSSSEWAFEKGSPAPVRSSVALGKAFAKSATNGIVPPAPMKTGSRPKASFIARRIASYALPSPASLYGLPAPLFFGEVKRIGLALRDARDRDVALLIV